MSCKAYLGVTSRARVCIARYVSGNNKGQINARLCVQTIVINEKTYFLLNVFQMKHKSNKTSHNKHFFKNKPGDSKTRTYHGRVGLGRTAGWWGRSGRTGRRQNSSPRRQASCIPSKKSTKCRLYDSPGARRSEIPFKQTKKHNDRMTSGW